MEQIIKSIHADWLKAKARAQRRCERAGLHDMAAKLGACRMFTGTETLPELIDMIFSPQGVEFMTSFGFPDMKTFRRFIPYHPEQYGVFIDAREVALTDAKRVYLIGNTFARLNYGRTQGNKVVMMHGARADINAAGYSVVKVETDRISTADITATEHAIISR